MLLSMLVVFEKSENCTGTTRTFNDPEMGLEKEKVGDPGDWVGC
jgi:hypothetical protein